MIKITIEATGRDNDPELLNLMRDHLCYALTDEMDIKLRCKDWDGHSGGDDAYFGLQDKIVKVEVLGL
jgi:hypothetical protein